VDRIHDAVPISGFDDILLLQTLCRNEDEIHRFRSVIEKEGFTITSKSGMVRAHPLLAQLRRLESDQRRILKQLLPPQPPPYRDRKPGRPEGFSPNHRRTVLRSPVLYVDHIEAYGRQFFQKVCELDLEGIVAKRKTATYRATEKASPYWIKIKNPRYSPAEGRDELFNSQPDGITKV
jgi:hypothetical protein